VGELARKRPADTVHHIQGVDLPRHETIIRPTRKAALAEIQRMARRGEVGSAYLLKETDAGWAVGVLRIKEARRPRPWLLIGLLAFLAAVLAGLLLLLVQALQALAPYLLLGAAVLALIGAASRRSGSISMVQSMVIKR
jgi:hypothetical protein